MFPDVFNADFFTMRALTAAINDLPYVPARIKELGLFQEEGVPHTLISVESLAGVLSLVPTQVRGGPPATQTPDKRKAVPLQIPHIPIADTLMADSILGVREMGSADRLTTVQAERDRRLAKMQRNLEFTLEWHRMGAIQGKVYDADGSTVILDCFTAFGVAEAAEIDFDLDNPTPASGALRRKCNQVKRQMAAALGAQEVNRVWAPCGDAFWDDLVTHPEVRDIFKYQQGQYIKDELGNVYETLDFAGILFENYRGSGAVTIGTDKCRFVPLGITDLFLARFAPANHVDAVNKPGLPFYASAEPLKHGKGVEMQAQTNPLHICTRPQVLQRARRT